MFYLTIFAGTEVEMAPRASTTLTLFGGAELRCPTLAAQVLHERAHRDQGRNRWAWLFGSEDNLVITLFGVSLLRMPTLIEEYQALTSLVESGLMSKDECRGLMLDIASRTHPRSNQRTLTMFGACTLQPPSASRERKALEAVAQTSGLRDEVRAVLTNLIAAPPEARMRGLVDLATT